MGDEHHVHVEYFHHRAHEEGVYGRGLLVLEYKGVHRGGHKAGQAGGHAARDAGVAAHAPVGAGDVALDAADQSRHDAGQGIEEQTCRQRTHVAHV